MDGRNNFRLNCSVSADRAKCPVLVLIAALAYMRHTHGHDGRIRPAFQHVRRPSSFECRSITRQEGGSQAAPEFHNLSSKRHTALSGLITIGLFCLKCFLTIPVPLCP